MSNKKGKDANDKGGKTKSGKWEKGGPSPNPKGRPKGSKNQKTLYKEAFDTKVTVNMDGEEKTMSRKELSYYQLAQKAASGDLKAIAMQFELDERFDPAEVTPPTPEESAADFQTLEQWMELRETFKVFKLAEENPPTVTRNDNLGENSNG